MAEASKNSSSDLLYPTRILHSVHLAIVPRVYTLPGASVLPFEQCIQSTRVVGLDFGPIPNATRPR